MEGGLKHQQKKRLGWCLALCLPRVRGISPSGATQTDTETDTQDRQTGRGVIQRGSVEMSTQSRLEKSHNVFTLCFFPGCLIITHPHPFFSFVSSSHPQPPLLPPHASLIGQLVKPQGRVIAR